MADKTFKEKIEQSLKKIRPQLQMDGGDVELVEVTPDMTVKVRLKGACGCCPMSQVTLRNGIEQVLREDVPEMKALVSV